MVNNFALPGNAVPGSSPNPSQGGCVADIPTHDALYRVDVLQEVFCRLRRIADLANAALVSRVWLAAARNDMPWRTVYIRQYGKPHAWETCSSFREQCARRVGLRWPQPSPALPGPPAPGAELEAYDRMYRVQTLAVTYEPVTGTLLRAVHSRTLVGDQVRVAVQAIRLQLSPSPAPPPPPAGPAPTTSPTLAAPAAAGPAIDDSVASSTLGQDMATMADPLQPTQQHDDQRGAGAPLPQQPTSPTRDIEAAAVAAMVAAATGATDARTAVEATWLCMLSADGRCPPPLPPTTTGADEDILGGGGAGLVDGGGDGSGEGAEYLTEADERQLTSLKELLPMVMCSGGGLLYLPAGHMGQGLAVWDLTTAPAAASAQQQQPYWLIPEAHPGRLLAAAADGSLAVSACDGGRLCFWHGRRQAALGQADVSHLTRLPVLDTFPPPPAHAGEGRHRMRVAICEASGLAAVVLVSPLASTVFVYRAAPLQSCASHGGDGGGGVGQLLTARTFGGAPCSGLHLFRNQLLIMQVLCSDVMRARFGGSGGSSVLVTVVVCVWALPPKETYEADEADPLGGGSGRGEADVPDSWMRLFSSRLQLEHPRTLFRIRPVMAASEDLMLLTVPRNVGGRPPHSQLLALELPLTLGSLDDNEDDSEEDNEEEGDGGSGEGGSEAADEHASSAEAAERRDRCGGGGEGGSREDHRNSLGRKGRPVPRPLPSRVTVGGGGRMMVVPEDQRLQWITVIEDAGEVVTMVVPTPHHLTLLMEGGRLKLYGIMPEGAVMLGSS